VLERNDVLGQTLNQAAMRVGWSDLGLSFAGNEQRSVNYWQFALYQLKVVHC
jgi:hypothetical protein